MKQKTITLLLALSLPTICFAQLKVKCKNTRKRCQDWKLHNITSFWSC